jgi:predicted  nucleic acid-binding Zn-ribbon protein
MGLKDAMNKMKTVSEAAQAKADEEKREADEAHAKAEAHKAAIKAYVDDVLRPLFTEIYNNAKGLGLSPAFFTDGEPIARPRWLC